MAKSAAERKAAQRTRQLAGGIKKVELQLDAQEVAMLAENCALRRPQREPYEMAEYVSMLIRKDNADLKRQLAEQSERCCGKCGERLPGDKNGCCFIGESECWQTLGWHETKLTA
ncbi:hypothetical protein VSX61_21940 [Brenneria populi subsp. brevivirga]|uniref:hypothetical protein n=1 Tax=Brenneria populi TaxID=1505588 RepID=UPI002E16DDE7|nr:hypothetical protein [Brenneria populi subsp. brevivirga]MEC5321551.1 hypothetical protein [Brenneria populi subsp. brevivirga]